MSHLTHGGLFNGIAGFALAARRAGIRTKWTCEIDPFCNAVSRKQFPHAHQYHDIHHVQHPARVDIISGGYPCQPESYAGKRRGKADNRWLWPEMYRIIDQVRPGWVLGENVDGHVGMGLESVLSDLEAADYEVWPLVIPACSLDAPHRRDRAWIIAHTHHRQPERPEQALRPGWDTVGSGREAAANSDSQRRRQSNLQPLQDGRSQSPGTQGHSAPAAAHPDDFNRRQQQQRCGNGEGTRNQSDRSAESRAAPGWAITQSPLCARNDGLPARLVRPDGSRDEGGKEAAQGHQQTDPKHWARNTLKAAGNALVPQIPQLFFQFIADYEAGLTNPTA